MVKTRKVKASTHPELEDDEPSKPVESTPIPVSHRKRYDIQTRVVDLDTGLMLYSQTCLFNSDADMTAFTLRDDERLGVVEGLMVSITNLIESARMYVAARIFGNSVPFDPSPRDHTRARASQLAGLLEAGKVNPGPTFVLPTDDPKKFLMVTELVKQ